MSAAVMGLVQPAWVIRATAVSRPCPGFCYRRASALFADEKSEATAKAGVRQGAVMGRSAVGRRSWWIDGLLLIAFSGGMVWGVTTGQPEIAAYAALFAWALLAGFMVRWNRPEAAAWFLALIAVGGGALAVCFFRLLQWAGWPVMAYLLSLSAGAFSLQAVLNLWIKRLQTSPSAGDAEGRGEP